MTRRRLLLFDIDGTLLDTGGVGLDALRGGLIDAFPTQAARATFPPLDLGGATDAGVAMHLFSHFGISDSDGNRRRFFEAYSARLRVCLEKNDNPKGKGRRLPGVKSLLSYWQADPDFSLALLTGNTADGARIKVDHFGVGEFFTTGAFGDDHHDRNRLGPIAKSRVEAEEGGTFSCDDIFVIGDTLKDIACARAAGYRVIAVATGSCSVAALAQMNPDLLLDDLQSSANQSKIREFVSP